MLIGIDASRAVGAERTGTENYTLYLIRALLALPNAHRYRLYFCSPPPEGLFERSERVEWRILPFPRLWTHIRLAWEVVRHPPDVLYVPAHVIPWLHPRHCVATVHDLGYLYYPQAHTRAARWYLDWSTRWNARVARRVVVDSQATLRDLVAAYAVRPDKLVVAYPAGAEGLAPIADVAALDAVRARYATGSDYYLYVGTLQPRKNLPTLVDAFAALVEQGTLPAHVRLVLAGKRGWLAEELLARPAQRGVADRVILPGYVRPEDLAALLSAAIAFVLPSRYEGFGLPVLEAMACDTPVICSRAASLPEVAGDAALLVDPDDVAGLAEAMLKVYRDAGLRASLIARGRQRLAAFSWERCAREVLAALESAAASG